ncbi:hypothetical protein EDD15DRAFT_2400498 [Pisolithus albus]|nr:hypothetical protein EDD15DRAFT_2400498 [Pisolithus albus]
MPANNPHLAMPPDFTSERFRQAREQIIVNGGDHVTAADQLALIWTVNNDLEKQEWDCQVQQQQQAAADRERQEAEERERLQLEREREREAALQEEKKKYRHKHAPIPQDAVISSDPIIIPSPIAVRKLRKGDFVELYYFTNKGLRSVESSTRSADDDALALLQMGDGLHSFVPLAAAQAKGTITMDEDLSWEEFAEAAHRLATAMRENEWPEDRVDSHIKFWIALEGHPWRHGHCEISKHALLTYQARVRRKWHDTLATPHSFNIALINTTLLSQIRDELVHSAQVAQLESLKQWRNDSPSPSVSDFRLTFVWR